MKVQHQNQHSYTLSTEQFAELNHVKRNTVSVRFSQTGSYYGVIPKKLANRRTVWPNVQVEA
ncbi:MAG: hypothetical protein Q8S55_21540 [Methylococcaceae bacterium]|nr:hypothetical protein [Methylococcaceae bacterium]